MKKMLCILSALGMLLTTLPALPASAEETPAVMAGDVNQTGDVNILDLICANKAMLGNVVLTPEQISAIDFNHNKQVDSEETLSLLKYCLLYTSPSPRDATLSRMPSSA